MKIIAVVPAKGTSERIKNKNLMLIDGEPLVARTLRRLLDSGLFAEVWLDTESEEVIAATQHLKCKIMRRDPAFATNATDGNKLFLNEVKHIDADIYFQVLCTAPFLQTESLQRGIEILRQGTHDSIVGGSTTKLYEWQNDAPLYDKAHIPNSVDLPPRFIESMGVYGITREAALRTQRRIGDTPHLLNLSPVEVVDVNTPDDLNIANLIAAGEREDEIRKLRILARFFTSALISDVLDDKKAAGYLSLGLTPNFSQARIFGRVKTVKLRALRDGEDPLGIYTSLDIYKTLRSHDILWVENPTPHAFFGELNASMAIRCGASGTIVNGPTRDSAATRLLNFPVFARGLAAQDIRGRGTVDGLNVPIEVGGQTVNPGTLVFADAEGLVCIPKAIENDVIETCIKRLETERGILSELGRGTTTNDIVTRFGNF